MTDTTGRAGFNVRHHVHGRGQRASHNAGARANRAGLLREAMRALDPAAADYFASQNRSIVRSETDLNVTRVNDGEGGFRRPDSVDDVLDYGDVRSARVERKLNPKWSTASTFVVMLPKSMCEEVPGFYPAWTDDDGKKHPPRSRWVARDRDEAIRYFNDAIAFLGDEVLTGGQAAIHGFDINFDETTPHVQILADSFGPDGDGNLRQDFSRIWTQHRDVVDGTGKQIRGREKLTTYQKGLREHMQGLGYEVELDAADRSTETLSKESYVEVQEAARAVRAREEKVAKKDTFYRKNLPLYKMAVQRLKSDQAALAAEQAELPNLRRKAVEEGREEGRAEGLKEGREEGRAEAAEITDKARRDASRIVAEAEIKADEKIIAAADEMIADERRRQAARPVPTYDPVEAVRDMHAATVDELARIEMPNGTPVLDHAREKAEKKFRAKYLGYPPECEASKFSRTFGQRRDAARARVVAFRQRESQRQSQSQDYGFGKSSGLGGMSL